MDTPDRELAGKLWWLSLLRGLAAMALGVWVLVVPPPSAGDFTRAVAFFWVVDGLLVLCAGLSAAIAMSRVFLVVRALAGIITALVLVGLPLSRAFGPYYPGQIILWLFVLPLVVMAVALQVVAAIFDLIFARRVRRRIPGEWTVGLGAILSIVFGLLLAGVLIAPPHVLGRGVGTVGVVGGLAVVIGAIRLRPAAAPAGSALAR